jgi:hypothetical protein
MVPKDEAEYLFCRANGIVVTSHPSTPVHNGLEEHIFPRQLGLTSFSDLVVYFPPPVGDYDYFFESVVTTKLPEHFKVPHRYPTHPNIGDPVEVEDTSEHGTLSESEQ